SEIERAGGSAVALPLDVTDQPAVVAAVAAIERQHGAIDVLVNCAGINDWCRAADLAPDSWARILDVNLNGTFYCCQAVGRGMLARRHGSIVNLASIAGVVGHPGVLAYAVSKAGVIQLTRSLAVEWAPVRVNALAPSTFETPLVRRNRLQQPEAYAGLLRRIPLGRTGQPAEIVGPVLFLASDASSMVTGHVLAVDGGYLAG
ncbi:MAG TPA: hypothetical protein DEP84_24815, partial [Chloroflexi bacterium]|nr:hypothetical protein [Chloroflexota bacterium]